jgi:hypothetical protein
VVTNSNRIRLTDLSIWLREAAEFHRDPLLAISVFYKCMFWYKSTVHKCDNCLLFWECCLHSDNLYGPLLVFIRECEFDNTDMEWTAYIECRHVSGVRTHRSVKWCQNPLNHQFLKLWFTQHCCNSSHCLQFRGLNKIMKHKKAKKKYNRFLNRWRTGIII